jgi:nucleoside-diphosphate-sugar epimerase
VEKGQTAIVLVRNVETYHKIGDEIVVQGDLAQLKEAAPKLQDYEIETCIHLAWEGIPDYAYAMSTRNLKYGLELLELCKKLNIRNLVMTGSCWEYDAPKGSVKTDAPISYANSFKAAKNALHMMAHAFCEENGIHLNWLRLFYVYGEGQTKKTSLIPYIVNSFAEGKQPELNGAHNRNDFVYVTDVAEAVVKVAMEHQYPEVLNVGSGKSERVLDIVRLVAKRMKFSLDESLYVKGNEIVDFYADKQEMWELYQWEGKVSMEEGIERIKFF